MAKVQHINVAYSLITPGLYGILSIEVLSELWSLLSMVFNSCSCSNCLKRNYLCKVFA